MKSQRGCAVAFFVAFFAFSLGFVGYGSR